MVFAVFSHLQLPKTRSRPTLPHILQSVFNRTSVESTHTQTCDYVRVPSATQWTDSVGTCFTHAQTCDDVRVQSAAQWTAWVHTLRRPKPVITFKFKALLNGLLRFILYTCPNLWLRFLFKVLRNGLLRYILPKPVITFKFKALLNGLFRFILYTCPNLWLGFLFKVLRNGLLRLLLDTCPDLWLRSCLKCYAMDCFGCCLTHARTCDLLWSPTGGSKVPWTTFCF